MVPSKKTPLIYTAFLAVLLVAATCSHLIAVGSVSPQDGLFAKTWFHIYSGGANSPSGFSPAALTPSGLSPAQVRGAYNLPSTGGNGTIALVDAFDYPTAQNDLINFSSQFGLPAPNFEKHMMPGVNSVDPGWSFEASLDIEWAHAIAPNAKILLVEATSNSFADLISAVSYAANRSDVVAVSMSWGGSENGGLLAFDSVFTSNHGVVFFASTGDSGSGVIWPSTSPNVVAVGGTTLNLDANGSVLSETGWSGSGGGVSVYESEPSYQVGYGVSGTSGHRGVPDVSYDADPATGFPIYDTTPFQGRTGWSQVGGTSAGSPQWAAIQSLGLNCSNGNFYADAKSALSASYFRDIVNGTNGGFSAGVGYDFVTGLGSPLTVDFSQKFDFSLSAFPTNLTLANGSSGNSTVTVASINGVNGTVGFSASLPLGWNASFTPQSVNVSSIGNVSSVFSLTVGSAAKSGVYQVVANGSSGLLSHNVSITVNVQTVPSSPLNLSVVASSSNLTLNWSAPSDLSGLSLTGYNVFRGNSSGAETKLASLAGNVSSYVDTQVLHSQVYFYQVTANNSLGVSPKSSEVNATLLNSTILSIVVVNGGSGYTTPAVLLVGGGGSGAAATARVSNGVILGVVLTNPGSGYTSAPTVVFRDPSPRSKGAAATAVTS